MTTDPNECAMPCANDALAEYNWIATGLTKREYFVAEAMKGLLANPAIVMSRKEDMGGGREGTVITGSIREAAIGYADDIIDALNQQ